MNEPSPLAMIPAGRLERWALLRAVVAQWYRPLQDSDGVAPDDLDATERRLGISLPKALREWYGLAGAREDVWARQDHFLPPKKFDIDGDYFVFMNENQHVVQWGILAEDLALDDPPVYISPYPDHGPWKKECDSVSEFALLWFAYNLKFANEIKWQANGSVTRAVELERVASRYPQLPLQSWHWPALTHLYGLRDVVIEFNINPDLEYDWIWVTARTAAAARALKDTLDPKNVDWVAWTEEWPQD